MENQKPVQAQEQEYRPEMLWEGFFYLAFFIFFCIYLIPNTPKSWSFDRYYPVAMLSYGTVGVLTGRLAYVVTRRMPAWFKIAIMVVLYTLVVYYLITHYEKFAIPTH